MSVNVKNAEVERLLDGLKRRTGKGTTDLLLDLLRRETERCEAAFEAEVARAEEEDRRLRDRFLARPILDTRPLDDEVEYDEVGLPR